MPVYGSSGGSSGISLDNFRDSPYGKALYSITSVNPPLKLATFGCSQVGPHFTHVHTAALAYYHDANIMYDERPVFVGENDTATTLQAAADQGQRYAVGASTPDHLINTQIPKFLFDVAAGKKADIGLSDFSYYNTNDTMAVTITKGLQMINAFFDPAGNNGMFFIVYGTFGQDPTRMRAWANFWQRYAETSGGRVLFVDVASVLIDPKNSTSSNYTTTAPTWAWKNNTSSGSVIGSVTIDGTHLSGYGAYLAGAKLAAAYRKICPALFHRPETYANQNYDPVNQPYGDVLGPGAGMMGTSGIDSYGAGAFPGTIAGTAHNGAGSFQNRYAIGRNFSAAPTFSITASPNAGNQQTITLPTFTTGGGEIVSFGYTPLISDVTGGNAARQYMIGFEVEYVNVNGVILPGINLNGSNITPVRQANSDSIPGAFSGAVKLRTLTPVKIPGANPPIGINMPFAAGVAIGGGVINIRNPFVKLVSAA